MRKAKNLFIPIIERQAKHEKIFVRRAKNEFLLRKGKKDTGWYDDLCDLYQRTHIDSLRNILWEQVRGLVHGRVHQFIREKKSAILRRDPDFCQVLFQESFFIFVKAVDIWDRKRRTKFLTFLGDILNQEILNKIRLHLYHKQRDWKLETKLKISSDFVPHTEPFKDNAFERDEFFEDIKILFDGYSFADEIDRDIAYTMVYGKIGDWTRLQKKSGLGIGGFYRKRSDLKEKLRKYIIENSTPKMREIIEEIMGE
jgi:hypothetical protein